jgi:hypothetical protein
MLRCLVQQSDLSPSQSRKWLSSKKSQLPRLQSLASTTLGELEPLISHPLVEERLGGHHQG